MTEQTIEKIEGVNTEEKTHKTEVKVDLSSIQADIKGILAGFKEEVMNGVKAVLTEEKMKIQPPVIMEDKTKGIIKEEVKAEEKKMDGFVIETADFGKGFQIYKNYDKENCKFKRLVR